MADYYNEIDPFAAAWLRELIKAGQIPDGEVDERSIELVQPDDLRGFRQCHFFAGIGGWALALRLAGWPDDLGVWTGSCPCQPWSAAGRGARSDDSRDVWPAWKQLIEVCRPAIVFGEQVASADGRAWLDRVFVDLEAAEYAVGAVNLPAASVGAFHTRERLWVVADAESLGARQLSVRRRGPLETTSDVAGSGHDCGLAHARCESTGRSLPEPSEGAGAHPEPSSDESGGSDGVDSTVGNPKGAGLQGERRERCATVSDERRRLARLPGDAWAEVEWLPCIDGKARPVEPFTFPLAHGVSGRVVIRLPIESATASIQEHWYNRTGALKGFGNAIVPQVAQVFIESYLEARGLK